MWKEIFYVFDIIFNISWVVTFFFVIICYSRIKSEQDREKSCCDSLILDILECVLIIFVPILFGVRNKIGKKAVVIV